MKKQLLLSLLAIVATSSSFAQITMEEKQNYDRKSKEALATTNNSKGNGGWFNYAREIEDISFDATGYIGILHTDSSMVDGYVDSNGDTISYTVYQHSRGQLLDPTSFNFIGIDGPVENFSAGEGFILDSIRFPYQYIRPQTTNPDKLIVQIYTNDGNGGIVQSSLVGGASFYHAEYDYLTNKGKNAVWTMEYDLTDADTTLSDGTGFYQSFYINPPIQMTTGGLVAATYTFIPGNTFNPGDTLASNDSPWNVSNPRNCFIGYYVSDAEATADPGYENYNLAITPDIQYNASATGWNGSYIPGNAWSNDNGPIINHQDIAFHLTPSTTNPPPANTINISSANIKLYPNPAKDKINIVFNNSSNIKNISITDITGRTVYTENIANNTSSIEVNTIKYNPGIYFCEINGIATVETIKFTKIK
tara:strand:- start:232 stop:1491 length:1260 start_codon:yes stop_codon:yes gene_type:complete